MSVIAGRAATRAHRIATRVAVACVCLVWASTRFANCTAVVDLSAASDTLRVDDVKVDDRLGSAAAMCDVNGDSWPDLVIGAERYDYLAANRFDAGAAYVVFGRPGAWSGTVGIASIASTLVIGADQGDYLGGFVSCADVNGDGFADLILGALAADGPNNARQNGGEVRIVFGAPTLPPTIDLKTAASTVLYGADTGEQCSRVAAGDINGDGTDDVVVGAPDGLDSSGFVTGRVYVMFGRVSWPSSIDFRVQRDVLIYGKRFTYLGENVIVGDLTGDGTDEIVSDAPMGDGPINRRDCGDVYVHKGRANWPATINLSTQSAEMRVFGADIDDRAGDNRGLAMGDPDGDGTTDLVIGARLADGRLNNASFTGETRSTEPGAVLPSSVDLATQPGRITYGENADDTFGATVHVGDANGDRTDDILTEAHLSDGPMASRLDCGAASITYGRSTLPAENGMGNADVLIYGALANDRTYSPGVGDVNGDGLVEAVLAAHLGSDFEASVLWLVSPVDLDGDGFTQLADNCPLVFNPLQQDTDQDRVGDACDGDYDADGVPDVTDCAHSNAAEGRPPALSNVFLTNVSGVTTLHWSMTPSAETYDVSRGLISALNGSDYGTCQNQRDANLADTTFVEPEVPPAGNGYYFLVRGRDSGCGGGGSWGTRSSGVERSNSNAGKCP